VVKRLSEAVARGAALAERGIRHAMAAIIVFLVLLNVAAAFGRYVQWYTWPWADEALLFTMVWGVALGLYAVTLRGGHLAMDLVLRLLPARLQRLAQVLVATVSFVLIGYVVVQSRAFIQIVAAVDMRSMAAQIPMTIPHTGVLVGLVLMMLALAVRAVVAAGRVRLPPEPSRPAGPQGEG
jgi:TRAP-type C4-dicarboxylate transport system permease small subunit